MITGEIALCLAFPHRVSMRETFECIDALHVEPALKQRLAGDIVRASLTSTQWVLDEVFAPTWEERQIQKQRAQLLPLTGALPAIPTARAAELLSIQLAGSKLREKSQLAVKRAAELQQENARLLSVQQALFSCR